MWRAERGVFCWQGSSYHSRWDILSFPEDMFLRPVLTSKENLFHLFRSQNHLGKKFTHPWKQLYWRRTSSFHLSNEEMLNTFFAIAYHAVQKVESSQAYRLILVVQTHHDEIFVSLDTLGMSLEDFWHCQESKVLHWKKGIFLRWSFISFPCSQRKATWWKLTVLVRVFDQDSQLLYTELKVKICCKFSKHVSCIPWSPTPQIVMLLDKIIVLSRQPDKQNIDTLQSRKF